MLNTITPIKNAPAYAANYPYIVARRDASEWWFWGAYQCEALATKAAIEVGGSVFCNRMAV